MPPPVLGDHVEAALRNLSSDPFVQAAIWRVYTDESALLTSDVIKTLDAASTLDGAALTGKDAPL